MSDLVPVARRWLYLNTLLYFDPDPPLTLTQDLLLHAASLPAGAEVEKRGQQHVGHNAAMLQIEQRWLSKGRTSSKIERRIDDQVLRKLVYPKARGAIRALREVHGFPKGLTGLRAVMDPVIWETLQARLSDRSEFELLTGCLKGRLNILPRAVVDDLRDDARTEGRRPVEEIVIDVEEVQSPDPLTDLPAGELSRYSGHGDQTSRARFRPRSILTSIRRTEPPSSGRPNFTRRSG